MGALSLAAPTLLSEQFELLERSAAESNGAGGRTSGAAQWTVASTVRGRRYTRAARANMTENEQGGRQSDPNEIEIALETDTVSGDYRIHALRDGRIYEIVTLAIQPPISFVHARQVA